MIAANMTDTTQYLTYMLGSEIYALGIEKVREVLDYPRVTAVPNMPHFLLGVINLRGTVVPVVDLRSKFCMERTEKTVNACVIITEVSVDGVTAVLGALADSVQEVVDLAPHEIGEAPRIGSLLRTDFIKGMGKRGDRFIIILDLDKVFSSSEVGSARAITEAAREREAA